MNEITSWLSDEYREYLEERYPGLPLEVSVEIDNLRTWIGEHRSLTPENLKRILRTIETIHKYIGFRMGLTQRKVEDYHPGEGSRRGKVVEGEVPDFWDKLVNDLLRLGCRVYISDDYGNTAVGLAGSFHEVWEWWIDAYLPIGKYWCLSFRHYFYQGSRS